MNYPEMLKLLMRKIMFNGRVAVLLITLLYISLAAFNINYPGLNTDEAFCGVTSSNILKDVSQVARGGAPFLNCHLVISGKVFPVMAAQYSSMVIPYLIYPFISFLGQNTVALRMASICILAFFPLFVYLLCKAFFGEKAGILSSLLVASNPIFVQYSRVGLYRCEIFVMFFFWLGLYYLIRYSQVKRYLFLAMSFFFFGVGFSVKITFLYYAVSLALACLAFGGKLNLFRIGTIKEAAVMLSSFCLGSFFIIIYNIENPWITFRQLFSALADPAFTGSNASGLGANNWAYLHNLGIRGAHLFNLLSGGWENRLDFGVTDISAVWPAWLLVAGLAFISLASVLFWAVFSSGYSGTLRSRILFFYVIYLVLFFLTPFTLSGFNQGHLMVILPFPQLITALFFVFLWERNKEKGRALARAILWLAVVVVSVSQISINLFYNYQMRKSGGYGRWATAVDGLADYLQRNDISSPVMFGYGLHANLIFLTGNRVTPVIYDKFYHRQPVTAEYRKLFSGDKPVFYLTFMPVKNDLENVYAARNYVIKEATSGKRPLDAYAIGFQPDENAEYRDLFIKYADEAGKKIRLERIFLNRAGHPVYWLYRIQ